MKKLNKRIRRAHDMIERYHLTTCPNVRMKDEIPAWKGYFEESIKYVNHAAMIADFIFDYCATRGMKTADFYLTQEGQQVRKYITFCREVSEEFARKG